MEPRPLDIPETTDLLRQHGITSTLQRVEIARLLLSKRQHLSAEQVLDKVNQSGNIVSKATVYNTLRLFAAKGLAREIIADPNKMFYEPQTNNHHHFFNVDTGELIDIEPGYVELDSLPQAPEGFKHAGVDVVIRLTKDSSQRVLA